MKMNRKVVIRRHNPVLKGNEINSPLSLGNGDFTFTADFTGFQTFNSESPAPLCIQSNWGWHSFPGDRYTNLDSLKLTYHTVNGRKVGYPASVKGQEEVFEQLRRTPHRLNLGRISLKNGCLLKKDFKDVYQELDLWTGLLLSSYVLDGNKMTVRSACHPQWDTVSFSLKSGKPLSGIIAPEIEFPYASTTLNSSGGVEHPGNFTYMINSFPGVCDLLHLVDDVKYFIRICYKGLMIRFFGKNRLSFLPEKGGDAIELVVLFSQESRNLPCLTAGEIEQSSRKWWESFWSAGGVIDFSGCRDPRAGELERRIVLSQYLTAIQCSGTLPPQETGLSGNSWYGKFHLEMHFWHAAHFPLWKRPQFLEKSMWWYYSILEVARQTAQKQGYRGVRWPKMTGPGGQESPSFIGPYLIWQQPHPIHYAELLYQANPSSALLERYRELVFETAEFMASYVICEGDRFILPPPLIPAQENHNPGDVLNPVFELEYWYFGLSVACKWYRRLSLPVPEIWSRVLNKLAPLPVLDGCYLAHENCPDTYTRFNRDHPSFLGAMGMLPGDRVRKDIMQNSLKRVFESWNFHETWGWDFPLMAMTAARTGLPELAVKALLMDTPKNTYLANGHNSQLPEKTLPLYLPGNGGLLLAVGLMTAGWRNGPGENAPGFPADGLWEIEYEDIFPAL